MKCKCKKNCRKAESILWFSYQNNIAEGERIRTVVCGKDTNCCCFKDQLL